MPLRLLLRRFPLGAFAVLIACAVLPASALATSTPPTLTVSPTTFAAGSAPNLTATVTFNANSGESAKDLTLELAPGVLANAGANSSCIATTNMTVNGPCQIGTDELDGSPLPADQVFLVPPPAGVTGAIAGLTTTYLSTFSIVGAVEIRNAAGDWPGTNAANVGLNLVFSNLPYTGSLLQSLALTLDSTLNGTQFTHAPTYCGTFAPALMSVDYENSGGTTPTTTAATDVAAPDITVTGCPLPFTPTLSATAAATQVNGSEAVALTGTVTFGSPLTSATTKDVTLTLPNTLSPNLQLVSDECSATDVTTCPTADPSSVVGTAGAYTAVLPTSDVLSGDVVLTKPASGIYPGLAIVISKIGSTTLPSAIAIPGSTNLLSSGSFQTTFNDIPDIALDSLGLSLSNTTLTTTCASTTGTLSGAFTDQNSSDPTVPASTTLTITGCPTRVVTPPPTITAPTLSGIGLSGLGSGKPKLGFSLAAGKNAPELSSFTVSLPSGLSFNSKTFAKGVSVAGAKIKTIKLSHGKLSVTLKSGVKSLKVTLSAKALTVSSSLKSKIKKKKVKSLTATIVAKDTSGKSTTIKLKLTKLS